MGILRKLLHSKCDRELEFQKDVTESWRKAHGSVVEHYSRIVVELRGDRYALNKERDELRGDVERLQGEVDRLLNELRRRCDEVERAANCHDEEVAALKLNNDGLIHRVRETITENESLLREKCRLADELRKASSALADTRPALVKQGDSTAQLYKERNELKEALESALRREAELVCRVADLRSSAAAFRTAVPFTESEIRDGLRLLVRQTDGTALRTLRQFTSTWKAVDDEGQTCMVWIRRPSARTINDTYIRPPKEA